MAIGRVILITSLKDMGMLWAKLWKLFGKEGERLDVWFSSVRSILCGMCGFVQRLVMASCVLGAVSVYDRSLAA